MDPEKGTLSVIEDKQKELGKALPEGGIPERDGGEEEEGLYPEGGYLQEKKKEKNERNGGERGGEQELLRSWWTRWILYSQS